MITRAKNRPQRVPLHKRRVLEAEQRPGYKRRWVNEEVGRINDFIAAGWTPVQGADQDISDNRAQTESNLGSVVRRVVNRDHLARAQTAVLMEIPEDLYNEDQAQKQKELDQKEAAMDPRKRKVDGADYGEFDKK